MDKKPLITVIIIILVVCIASIYAVSKSNDYVLQGEIDMQTINVSSKVPGRVVYLSVKKGDVVTEDRVLAILDTPEIKAKLEQTNALLAAAKSQNEKADNGARNEQIAMALNTLKQAQAGQELANKTYLRMKNLYEEGVIPAQKMDEALAAYNSANSTVAVAKSNYQMLLNGTRKEDKSAAAAQVKQAEGAVNEVESYLSENTIKAPIGGEVTQINSEIGELVATGFPIVVISNPDDVWAVFNVREDMLKKIKIGKVIKVKIPAISNDKYEFKVNYISVMGNFATWKATRAKGEFDMKTFEVRMVPVKKIDGLRAGMSVLADWNKIK